MRLIKLAIISFALIFLVVTFITMLIPSQVRISRAVDIEAPGSEVFPLIKDQSQWDQWHPVFADSAARREWLAADKQVVASTDSTYILKMQKTGRKAFVTGWQLYRYPNRQTTTVQWYMDIRLAWYPWEKFSSLFFERTYGAMMEQGLANLRKVVTGEGPPAAIHP